MVTPTETQLIKRLNRMTIQSINWQGKWAILKLENKGLRQSQKKLECLLKSYKEAHALIVERNKELQQMAGVSGIL